MLGFSIVKPSFSFTDVKTITNHYNHICAVIEAKALKIKHRNSCKLEKKFNNLKRKFGIPRVSNLSNDDIIFNYSHRALTET